MRARQRAKNRNETALPSTVVVNKTGHE